VLRLKVATRFKKDIKKYKHDKIVQDKLEDIIKLLVNEKKLPEKNRDHDLVGNYIYHRECHITPDTLLIYKKDDEQLSLERIGSHSELF
jgi:mRNA interferase YafQ